MGLKRSLSILEVLLGISLLSVSFGFTCYQMNRAYKQEQFEKNTSLFVEEILFARDLSLNLGTDLWVDMSLKEDGLHYALKSHSPLTNVERFLTAKTRLFKNVSSFSFDGKERKCFCIHISNGGLIQERGMLRFNMKDTRADITLSPIPKRIS